MVGELVAINDIAWANSTLECELSPRRAVITELRTTSSVVGTFTLLIAYIQQVMYSTELALLVLLLHQIR